MRPVIVTALLLFVATGVVLGALNPGLVRYDLGFVRLQLPGGSALLAALMVGWLLGGVTVWLGIWWRKRHTPDESQAKARRVP